MELLEIIKPKHLTFGFTCDIIAVERGIVMKNEYSVQALPLEPKLIDLNYFFEELIDASAKLEVYKEKLKGHWLQSGASYANDDIFGLWLKEFNYSGIDGEVHTGKSTVGSFEYRVYITGNESGKCFLYVKGNPNGFCSTLGEIGFSDDYSFFTLSCSNSSFAFVKG